MIDCHVITLPTTNRRWLGICLSSLLCHPVNVRIIEGVEGHIGLGRKAGFSWGTSDYVAYVDPDDWVLDGAFTACAKALERNPSAALGYTREVVVNEDGILLANHKRQHYEKHFGRETEILRAHHLCVYRREMLPTLDFFEEHPHYPEVYLKRYLRKHLFAFADLAGYVWRQHEKQAHTKQPNSALICRLDKQLKRVQSGYYN